MAQLSEKIASAMEVMLSGAVLGAAAMVAIIFFSIGAFVWIDQSYGLVAACLSLGGFYLLVALLALAALLALRRRFNVPRRVPAPAQPQWWQDPALLATGLQLGRTLGASRLIPMLVIGALAANFLLGQQHTPTREQEIER